MSKLQVYTFPHPVLQKKARPVERFDAELAALADSMLETMYEDFGIGLAANQVGELQRILVIDLQNAGDEEDPPEQRRDPHVFVNPRLLESEGEIVTEEGCLSVVEFTAEVTRAQRIRVAWQTVQGEAREGEFEDIMAVCLQHEMDHLDGRLFIDRLPPLKRQMVRKRLAKAARESA